MPPPPKTVLDPLIWLVNFTLKGVQLMIVGPSEALCYLVALQVGGEHCKHLPRPIKRSIVVEYVARWRHPAWNVPTEWVVYSQKYRDGRLHIRDRSCAVPLTWE